MNSSDITEKRRAQVIYTQQLEKFKNQNPSGDCEKICNCTDKACVKKFQSYEIKQLFTKGMQLCPCAPESE